MQELRDWGGSLQAPLGPSTALQFVVKFCWDYFKCSSHWGRIFHKYIWSIKIWSEAKWSNFICPVKSTELRLPGQALSWCQQHSILKFHGALLILGRHYLTHLCFRSHSMGAAVTFWTISGHWTIHVWTEPSVLYKKICKLEIARKPPKSPWQCELVVLNFLTPQNMQSVFKHCIGVWESCSFPSYCIKLHFLIQWECRLDTWLSLLLRWISECRAWRIAQESQISSAFWKYSVINPAFI